MKHKTVILVMTLVMAMLLGLLSGCGNETAASAPTSGSVAETEASPAAAPTAPTAEPDTSTMDSAVAPVAPAVPAISYPLVEEEVVLTQWGSMYPGSFNYISSLSENTVIDELAERTGVRLECVSVQGGPNTIDQFTLMISAGDLPKFIDNVYSCYTAGADAAIADEVIVDLAPYLEEDCPDFVRLYDEFPGMEAFAHTDDGAVPFFLDVSRNYDAICNSGYVIRQDWLDQLELDMPETFDELHDVLAAFKNDLNVGSPLYIPKGVTGTLSDAFGVAVSLWRARIPIWSRRTRSSAAISRRNSRTS